VDPKRYLPMPLMILRLIWNVKSVELLINMKMMNEIHEGYCLFCGGVSKIELDMSPFAIPDENSSRLISEEHTESCPKNQKNIQQYYATQRTVFPLS